MLRIQRLTADPKQTQTVVVEDGTTFSLEIYYRPIQQGWFINSLVYGDFVINGMRIVVTPNMLHQFRNKIPFGIACLSDQNREPSLIEDFESGAAKLYLLNQTECEEFSSYLFNGQI